MPARLVPDETANRARMSVGLMIIKHKVGRTALVVAFLGASLLLQGCRDEEQGRPVSFEPGKYQGKPDTEVTDAQRNELRSRAKSGQTF